MKAKKLLKSIDWSELRNQKTALLNTISSEEGTDIASELEGLVHLIDALQDYAVDELGIDEKHIFDFDVEEERKDK